MEATLNNIQRVYFLGIGGIGMSALARYFAHKGIVVAGYDSTPSPLTEELTNEGMAIHFNDSVDNIPDEFKAQAVETLIVYTPAVPSSLKELQFFRDNGYNIAKRSEALGIISKPYNVAGVAGTHGKTSTSTLLAHLLCRTKEGCDAFLGGISKNFSSNLVLNNTGKNRLVVEADEFDRSFLNLNPVLAIITSIDADHLDIYGNHQKIFEAYGQFVSGIKPNGTLIIKQGLEGTLKPWISSSIKVYTYGMDPNADFYPAKLRLKEGYYHFDLNTPDGVITNLELGIPGLYNVENAIAASAAAIVWGIKPNELSMGLESFRGVKRRFDVIFKNESTIYIDDYAHHPKELKAAIGSARSMFPNRKITGVFQPHLYSRTNDFMDDFAEALSLLDAVILTDIYPAREQPIEGVTSAALLEKVRCEHKELHKLNNIVTALGTRNLDVLLTMGAGNIDRVVSGIELMLKGKEAAI